MPRATGHLRGMFIRPALLVCLASILACGPEPGGGSSSTTDSTGSTGAQEPTGSTGTDTPTTTGAPQDTYACDNSTPLPQAGEPAAPSGFERCDNEAVHRVEPVECTTPQTPSGCIDNSNGGECTVDVECTEAPFGSCQQNPSPFDENQCMCVYGCRTDADCSQGQICRCAGEDLGLFTQCIEAGCASDAGCDGGWCALSPDPCEPGGYKVACLDSTDECFGTDNCDRSCRLNSSGWACEPFLCG